ncbi:hypothetical protein SAMN04487906_0012 [Zhouia amylolytica]|uniref:Lipoprotein n=2 Tax=Zhouia amylolytica TaxID=376730 RepID=A0A1I6NYD8_9FLAO|nr:hypothetical protein [Zhouia amylolytica]SFS32885.1 hypothetical protein SAMN04487906_0012 [Zhouia amylolytica]
MKDIINQMLKVQNGHKKQLFIVMSIMIFGCSSVKQTSIDSDEYDISRYQISNSLKSKNLNISIFDYVDRNKRISGAIEINGVFINNQNLEDISLSVSTNKTYDISILYLSKKPININNLKVKKGDSIAINVFMKDSMEPIHEQ